LTLREHGSGKNVVFYIRLPFRVVYFKQKQGRKTMDKKFAVLVDGDNISAKDYESVIKQIASTYGEILIKRVYGDLTTSNMKAWKEVLEKEPATLFHQFRLGKNATDNRIIIDAAELRLTNANINANIRREKMSFLNEHTKNQ
jgi:hypothetical protein